IDERGMIVRPAETAPAPSRERPAPRAAAAPADVPTRFVEIMAEAAKIRSDPDAYHAALRDWIANGSESRFALDPETVIARSRPRDADVALGHAHFELATQLEVDGHHEAAVQHFREAHRLVPDSWTFRRQAWSLEALRRGLADGYSPIRARELQRSVGAVGRRRVRG
ncbi:MAG: ResA-like WAxxUGC motif-containing protein, partial [Gammaproteobacteria bacterium]